MIVQPNDFQGRWAITQKYNANDLQQVIDLNEEPLIYELLGVDLGNELLTNLGDLPPELDTIFKRFSFTKKTDCAKVMMTSQGIKVMLQGLIYGIYYLTQLGTATSEGLTNLKPEGGELSTDSYSDAVLKYNEGIKTWRAIQAYIKENKNDYPTFEGVDRQTIWLI